MAFLPSWRPGKAKDAITAFLDDALALPAEQRVAVLDNDGTLWCEKPNYIQYDFLVRTLHAAAEHDGALAQRPEYRALLDGDHAALGELGLQRVAVALMELCAGWTPDEFTGRVRDFMATEKHPGRGAPYPHMVYQPMLELLDVLRAHGFDVFVVTGGGTEFVRAVSRELYGVRPDDVVGTLIEYHYEDHGADSATLRRTAQAQGEVNEGQAKVEHIQTQLGRRPIFAAGNSAGDREMLEYARTSGTPSLALLVDHDDAEREYAYESRAVSFTDTEPITAAGHRLGWTIVSVRDDWATVFPP
jgi:phosphoserine phosphatase